MECNYAKLMKIRQNEERLRDSKKKKKNTSEISEYKRIVWELVAPWNTFSVGFEGNVCTQSSWSTQELVELSLKWIAPTTSNPAFPSEEDKTEHCPYATAVGSRSCVWQDVAYPRTDLFATCKEILFCFLRVCSWHHSWWNCWNYNAK